MVLHNAASSVRGGPSGIVMTGELCSLVEDRLKKVPDGFLITSFSHVQ